MSPAGAALLLLAALLSAPAASAARVLAAASPAPAPPVKLYGDAQGLHGWQCIRPSSEYEHYPAEHNCARGENCYVPEPYGDVVFRLALNGSDPECASEDGVHCLRNVYPGGPWDACLRGGARWWRGGVVPWRRTPPHAGMPYELYAPAG